MLKVGEFFKTRTTTKDDVFGEVVWRVRAVGIRCPTCKGDDAVHCEIVWGTGPAARPGYSVVDCSQAIARNFASGVSKAFTAAEAARLSALAGHEAAAAPHCSRNNPLRHSGTGVVEV